MVITILDKSRNELTTLPVLPSTSTHLYYYNNQLTTLPVLPSTLTHLYCGSNRLTTLPILPNTLIHLDCGSNQLTTLPVLPSTLKYLDCKNNQLTTLPVLPRTLKYLDCNNNQLTTLPVLPRTLTDLYCDDNTLIWCYAIKDAEIAGLNKYKVAKIHRIICKYYARNAAAALIQCNCESWLDKPITNDGKMGIRVRVGMKVMGHDVGLFPPQ